MRTAPARGPSYVVGLDLGQATDYSALAVVERSEAAGPDGRLAGTTRCAT